MTHPFVGFAAIIQSRWEGIFRAKTIVDLYQHDLRVLCDIASKVYAHDVIRSSLKDDFNWLRSHGLRFQSHQQTIHQNGCCGQLEGAPKPGQDAVKSHTRGQLVTLHLCLSGHRFGFSFHLARSCPLSWVMSVSWAQSEQAVSPALTASLNGGRNGFMLAKIC